MSAHFDRRQAGNAVLCARLAPLALELLESAADQAWRFHASAIGAEHLLVSLMRREDCAAARLLLHASADPGSVADEAQALSEGLCVLSANSALPFSPQAVCALFRARAEALQSGRLVDPELLARAAACRLEPGLQEALLRAGSRLPAAQASEFPDLEREAAALFRSFDVQALAACGKAARGARQRQRASISPAHLLQGCLELAPELMPELHPAKLAELCAGGKDADPSQPPERQLALDPALASALALLPPGSDSLALLRALVGWSGASAGLRALIERQRLGAALLFASQSGIGDA